MDFYSFSFRDVVFRDVVAASHGQLSKIAVVDVEPLEGRRLRSIGMDVRVLPDVGISRLWCSAGTATRTPLHVAEGNDDIALVLPADTDMTFRRRGHEDLSCRPGEAYVWAVDEPATIAYGEDCRSLSITLPRAALSPLVGNVSERLMDRADPSRAAGLWLLRGYSEMLLRGGGPLGAEASRLASDHMRDLAALLLAPERERVGAERQPGVRAARLGAIKADITANAALPLSPEEIALRHGISPRYLRALFAEEETSFSDYLRDQRLARAARMLREPALAGRTVAAIAYEAGFNDLSYFNRIFRRRYGMTPSEARAGPQ